jgi:hypothetical protein
MQRMGRSGETGRLLGRLDALPDRAGRLKPPIWEAAMSTLTRKDVTAMFGELDDVVIAKIIARRLIIRSPRRRWQARQVAQAEHP